MGEDGDAVVGADACTIDSIERHCVDTVSLHAGEGAQGRVFIETRGNRILIPIVVLDDNKEDRIGVQLD